MISAMGKKKRGVTASPFCFYCNREFAEEKVLVQHQKVRRRRARRRRVCVNVRSRTRACLWGRARSAAAAAGEALQVP